LNNHDQRRRSSQRSGSGSYRNSSDGFRSGPAYSRDWDRGSPRPHWIFSSIHAINFERKQGTERTQIIATLFKEWQWAVDSGHTPYRKNDFHSDLIRLFESDFLTPDDWEKTPAILREIKTAWLQDKQVDLVFEFQKRIKKGITQIFDDCVRMALSSQRIYNRDEFAAKLRALAETELIPQEKWDKAPILLRELRKMWREDHAADLLQAFINGRHQRPGAPTFATASLPEPVSPLEPPVPDANESAAAVETAQPDARPDCAPEQEAPPARPPEPQYDHAPGEDRQKLRQLERALADERRRLARLCELVSAAHEENRQVIERVNRRIDELLEQRDQLAAGYLQLDDRLRDAVKRAAEQAKAAENSTLSTLFEAVRTSLDDLRRDPLARAAFDDSASLLDLAPIGFPGEIVPYENIADAGCYEGAGQPQPGKQLIIRLGGWRRNGAVLLRAVCDPVERQ